MRVRVIVGVTVGVTVGLTVRVREFCVKFRAESQHLIIIIAHAVFVVTTYNYNKNYCVIEIPDPTLGKRRMHRRVPGGDASRGRCVPD